MSRPQLRRTGIRVIVVPITFAMLLAMAAVAFLPAGATPAAAAVLPGAGQYVPLNPSRVVSRQSIDSKGTWPFAPLGKGGVPATNVSAVAVTVTARSLGTGNGQVIAFPAGTAPPTTSAINYRPNISVTNSLTMRLGTNGQISLFNEGATDAAMVWIDILGYYTTSAATGAGSTYVGLTPTRLWDDQAIDPNAPKLFSPLGKGGVPTANVSAVVVNIIVHGGGTSGEALAYPEGVDRQWHTMVFYQGDFHYNNQVAVKLGTGGQFRVHTTTATKVDIDVVGYFQTPAGTVAGGSFVGTNPSRVGPVFVDSKKTYTFKPLGQGGIPASGVSAVAFNLTVTEATAAHTMTVFPAGITLPAPANQLSYRQGPWGTQQYVKVGTDGQVSIHNNGPSRVRLLIDLVGYYRAATAPAAPTAVVGLPVDRGIDLSWTRPATDGGASITGYRITANPGGATLDTIDVTNVTFAGLTNGTAYTFTVAARNAAGLGPASAASAGLAPRAPTAPAAPSGVTAQARDKSAVVRWQKPDHGGLAVRSYTVTATPGGATTTVTAPTTAALVTGLTNGTAYTFAVTAANGIGTGAAGRSAAVTPGLTVPDAPGQVSAGSAGNGSISVGWSRPRYTGGSALTGYVVTVQPGGRTVTVAGTATEAVVTGLTEGSLYTLTVAARNATGLGPASNPSKPVRPDLRFKPGAKEISPAALATMTTFGTSRLVFTNAPAEVTGLTAGTIVVAFPGDHVTDGFVRKVLTVTISGATTTVTTQNANPDDAFAANSFSMESDLAEGSGMARAGDVGAMAEFGHTITIDIPEKTLNNMIKVSGSVSLEVKVGFHEDRDGDKILTLSGTLKQNFTVTGVLKAPGTEEPKARHELRTTDIPALKGIKFLRPTVNADFYLWFKGSLDLGTALTIDASQTVSIEVNMSHPTETRPHVDIDGSIDRPQLWNTTSGGFTAGMGVDLKGQYAFLDVAKMMIQPYVDFKITPLGNPSMTAKGCGRIGAEGPSIGGESPWSFPDLYTTCPFDFPIEGAVFGFPVNPGDIRLARNAKFTFTAKNRIPGNEITWSVEGQDNGEIDEKTGVYTAPNKDGVFTIIARAETDGPMPPEEGRATVRVGTPDKPTVSLTTFSSADGFNRVRITITGAATGNPATGYKAYVVPNLNPGGRCLGYWEIPNAGSFTLRDRLDGSEAVSCGMMPTGAQIRFRVFANNDYGSSDYGESNVVTVTS